MLGLHFLMLPVQPVGVAIAAAPGDSPTRESADPGPTNARGCAGRTRDPDRIRERTMNGAAGANDSAQTDHGNATLSGRSLLKDRDLPQRRFSAQGDSGARAREREHPHAALVVEHVRCGT
jgi:hypothetical protein